MALDAIIISYHQCIYDQYVQAREREIVYECTSHSSNIEEMIPINLLSIHLK